ncbi:hypothetical protein L1887_05821 [Cichorium endivia]|nr:hypothetical protein L1887_05821 [Cichorium endivia]
MEGNIGFVDRDACEFCLLITSTLRSSQSHSQSSGSSSGGKRSNAPRAAAALVEEFKGIDLDGTHFDPFEDDPTDSEAHDHHCLSEVIMDRPCLCGNGLIVRRIANSSKNKNKAYYACPTSKPLEQNYGCGFFRWEHDVIPGASWSSASSPGPSSRGKGSSSTGPSSAGKGSASCFLSPIPGKPTNQKWYYFVPIPGKPANQKMVFIYHFEASIQNDWDKTC